MEPTFRDATADDAGPIAYMAHMAGRGHARISTYDLIIPGPPGPSAQRIYMIKRLVAAETVCMLHFTHHRVACVEGRAVACMGALTSGEAGLLAFVRALKEIGWTEAEVALMRTGMSIYNRVEPPVPRGSWAIENVATLPEYRRRGLAAGLLEMTLEQGRRLGHRSAQLAVHIGNDAARDFYGGNGFEITAERKDPEFEAIFGCPGMWEMVRRL